jgi:hypothetical protein
MDKITIHTELPIKKSETLVTIAFAYGFLNEADSLFGVGHLIEHCLCSQIKKKLKPKHVWGHIDDRTLVINILLSNFAFESLFKQGIVQTVLKIGKSINSKDIAIEKRRIKSEVEDRYSLPIPFLSQYIRNHLIKEPKRLARWRTDQVKNLHTLTTNKITKALEDIFSTRHSVFVGTSDKNKQIQHCFFRKKTNKTWFK